MNPNSKRRLQLVAGFAVFAVAVVVSYFSISEEGAQDTITQDVFLVIDTSGSMADNSKLYFAKEAASAFVNTLQLNGTSAHQIGLISFSDSAVQAVSMTNNLDSLNNGIEELNANGGTAMGDGILLAVQLLEDQGRPNTSKTIVLLSDGVSNIGILPHSAAQYASSANVTIYSVGYGYDADVFTLHALASSTNGDYFAASSGQEVASIFDEIAKSLISPISHYSSRVMMLVAIPILLFIPAIEAGLTAMMGIADAPVRRNVSNRICPYCQHSNRQVAKFCLKCGKPLQQSSQYMQSQTQEPKISKQNDIMNSQCSNCKHHNRQTAKFCLKCGKSMNKKTSTGKGDL